MTTGLLPAVPVAPSDPFERAMAWRACSVWPRVFQAMLVASVAWLGGEHQFVALWAAIGLTCSFIDSRLSQWLLHRRRTRAGVALVAASYALTASSFAASAFILARPPTPMHLAEAVLVLSAASLNNAMMCCGSRLATIVLVAPASIMLMAGPILARQVGYQVTLTDIVVMAVATLVFTVFIVRIAQQVAAEIAQVPGAADVHIHQVVDWPEIDININRDKAGQLGMTERDVTTSLLISLAGSSQLVPTQWLNWQNGVNYGVSMQTPQYRMNSIAALMGTPIAPLAGNMNYNTPGSMAGVANWGSSSTGAAPNQASQAYGNPGAMTSAPQRLANLATLGRNVAPEIVNHYNIMPVYDVYANVDRRDLGAVGAAVDKIVKRYEPKLPRASSIDIRGQYLTMQSSFNRLGVGIIFAVLLVYMLMVINFQSWLDPFIILMALPGALAGIVWMLFLTQTTFSVPSLMGAMMCIGVSTSNSILLVVFANDQRMEGHDARSAALSAGFIRIRPVIMTAAAMIIGMLPMALGMGEGGEQNAPLGRAVIGGLLLATVTTLFVVPLVYSLLRKKTPVDYEQRIVEEEHEYLQDQATS